MEADFSLELTGSFLLFCLFFFGFGGTEQPTRCARRWVARAAAATHPTAAFVIVPATRCSTPIIAPAAVKLDVILVIYTSNRITRLLGKELTEFYILSSRLNLLLCEVTRNPLSTPWCHRQNKLKKKIIQFRVLSWWPSLYGFDRREDVVIYLHQSYFFN